MEQYFWKFELIKEQVKEQKDIFAHISLCPDSENTLSAVLNKIESLFYLNDRVTLMCSLGLPEDLVLDSDKKNLYFRPRRLVLDKDGDQCHYYRWDLSAFRNYKPYKDYWHSSTMIGNYCRYNHSMNKGNFSTQDHALDMILLDFFKYLKLKSFA